MNAPQAIAQSILPQTPLASAQKPPQIDPTIQPDTVQFGAKIDADKHHLIKHEPKVELHAHLDGSADDSLYKMELIAQGEREGLDQDSLRERLRVARRNDKGLEGYRERYDKNKEIMTIKKLHYAYKASEEFAQRAIRNRVRYFEIRSNPFPENGTAEELIRFIQEGVEDAKADKPDYRLDYGILLLAYRHGDNSINPETGRKKKVDAAIKVAETAIELQKKGYPIVGVDLAGGELDNPVTDFKDYFDVIKKHNKDMVESGQPEKRIGITIHAGETPKSGHLSGPESIRGSIRLAWDENTPVRIGHGTQIVNDPALIQEVIDKNIGLEMCPKSNVQTQAVNWYTDHPALELSRKGVKVSIATDNQTISKTDPTNEFVKLHHYLGATHEDRKRMALSGIETAFIPDEQKKQAILKDMQAEFEKMKLKPTYALGLYKEQLNTDQLTPWQEFTVTVASYLRAILFGFKEFLSSIFNEPEAPPAETISPEPHPIGPRKPGSAE